MKGMATKPRPPDATAGRPRTPAWPATRGRADEAADAPSERDAAIDLLRGAALVVMVVNHLVGASWIHAVTLGRYYVTAAEGFVFCSALVLGHLARKRMAAGGLAEVARKALARAATLYLAAVALIVGLGLLATVAPGWARPAFDAAPTGGLGGLLAAATTFRLQPPIIDILPMYVLFMLLVPALAAALARGLWPVVVAASVATWAFNWLDPYALSAAPLDRGGRPYFAFASWQVLFVVTFAAAWHREGFERAWAWVPRSGWAIGLGAITLGLLAVAQFDPTLGDWPLRSPERESWLAATDRSLLGPVRLMAVAALLPLLLMAIRAAYRPLVATLGPLLLPLGRHSLYVYLVHVPIVVLWTVVVAPRLGGNAFVATLGQAGVVALLWWLVRRRAGFAWIPR